MSSTTVNVVAIAGLTGRMSRFIAKHLLDTKPNVTIHGIVRDPAKLSQDFQDNPKVKVFEAACDEKEKLKDALSGADVCICGYSGGPDVILQGQKNLIDACVEAGVKRYVASDWCLDYRDLEFGGPPIKDAQKHIAAYLEEHAPKIHGVHVLNGTFFEAFFLAIVGIVDADTDTFVYFGDGNVKWDFTTYNDAARFTAEAACDPGATGFLNFWSDHITTKEVAEAWSRVYEVEAKLKQGEDLEAMGEKAKTAFKEQPTNVAAWAFPWYLYWVQRPGDAGKCKGNDAPKYPGMGPVTRVEDFLKKWNKEEVGKSGKV